MDTTTFWIIILVIFAVIAVIAFARYTRRSRLNITIPGASLDYEGSNDPTIVPPTPAIDAKNINAKTGSVTADDSTGRGIKAADITAGTDVDLRSATSAAPAGHAANAASADTPSGDLTAQNLTAGRDIDIQHGGTRTVDQSRHTVFDQRYQQVGTQYNIAGDYNPAGATDRAGAVLQLQQLLDAVAAAQSAGHLNADTATDVEYQLKKAVNQAQKPDADKRTILEHLETAQTILTTAAAAAGIITAISQAAQMIQRLF